jgi:fatty-acyl-CoA synthase
MVIGDFLKQHAAERPDVEALVFKDRRITYRDYDARTDETAAGLIRAGVKPGDRIGIYVPNWPEFIFTYLGAAKIGAITVPVSWRFTPQEISFILNDSGVTLVTAAPSFMGVDMAANLKAARESAPSLKTIVLLGETEAAAGWATPWADFVGQPDGEVEAARRGVEPADPVLFIYTSGTTGVPKAAMLTHKNVITYTKSVIKASSFTKDDSILLDIPLNHVGAAVMGVITCLLPGAKLVLMDGFIPEETLKVIQAERITVMGQVPAQYSLQLLHPNVQQYDLSSIKTAIVSSQPCPTELLLEMKRRLGIFPINAYGLSETSGTVTLSRRGDSEEKLTYTVGVPIEGVEVAIMDENGEVLPQGSVGEIVIRGDVVMKGYYNRPEEDKKVFDEKGYLHTGDMGKLDEDGYLMIAGRKKEMYIRGGENVYPPEIEEAISQHPSVFMAAVVGRPDPIMGEVGRAYIIPRPGTDPTEGEIKEFLKGRLANYKIPVDIIFRPTLPTTPLGKIKKLDLYKEVQEEFKKS